MKNKIFWLFLLLVMAVIPFAFTLASQDPTLADPIAVVSDQGVEVSLLSSEVKDGRTLVTSCIDLPDNQDWIVYTSITDGKSSVVADSMAVLSPKDPKTFESSLRCYEFEFPVSFDPARDRVTFTVDKLATTLPEALDQSMCDDALTEIQKERPDVFFSCVIDPHGVAFENTSPDGAISDKDLHQLINTTLTETVTGPWSLTLNP